jgi:hypothetical protein
LLKIFDYRQTGAVLNCPEMDSDAYNNDMIEYGRGAFIIFEGLLAIDEPFL